MNGEKNPNWRGGVTVTNRGYRKKLMADHPRADRNGYVLEHVLVVERGLGRKLLPDERVHHLNGVKLDNCVDNLLVFKNHGDHLRYGHASHKDGQEVSCDTCGTKFYKRKSQINKWNFCKQSHQNPNLWRKEITT